MQQALSNPPKITQDDTLAQRILSSVLTRNDNNPITLESATTKQLRSFLRQDTPPDPNSSTQPEIGTSKQWPLALANTLPDSATLASSPIEWWFETTDTTIKALRLRVEDLFQLTVHDNGLLQLVRRTHLPPKLRLAQVELGLQAYQERRRMCHSMQQALSNPPKITQDDTLAQRILSSVLTRNDNNPITLESATTKQLRSFLK
ncbi:MAG: hypothetical protein JOS17DRAFT_796098 [Linnemannia elongata]|nr:MAG: hypothetical protein JOS17DRAFT_796098 [Linnemannia elongata]